MDAAGWDERYRSADLVWGTEPNRFVAQYCADLSPGDAVDVACGEGRNAIWLASLGWTVLGMDFSPVAIERAETLAAALTPDIRVRLRWRVGDVTEEPLPAASTDLVVVSYVHLPPDRFSPLLTACARAVRRGGHLFVVGHHVRNLREGVSGPQDPALLYDPDTIADQLGGVDGMRVQAAETVERPTAEGVALDAVVTATCPNVNRPEPVQSRTSRG